MWKLPDPRFDVASALDQGSRDYQEDSLVTDFPIGDDCGIVVLADGMGGHSAGDIASNIIVTEVFGDLKFQRPHFAEYERELPAIMVESAQNANRTLGEHVQQNPESRGMGTTLVAAAIVGPNIYWTSVGDSPLFLFRNGKLKQLNQDHSMAPQIELMVQTGMMKREEAENHPDRNSLTSAIFGGDIAKIDAPGEAFALKTGDILIVSSDGIQYLDNVAIERIVSKNRRRTSAEIANSLLQALKKLDDPDQDNISFAVVKVNYDSPLQRNAPGTVAAVAEETRAPSASATRLASRDLLSDWGGADEDEELSLKRLQRAVGD